MARFCMYCGGSLNADGRCPKCEGRGAGVKTLNAARIQPTAPRRETGTKTGGAKKTTKRKEAGKKRLALLIVLIALAVLILAFFALCALQAVGVLKIAFLGKMLDSVGLSCTKSGTEEMDMDVEPTIVDDGVLEPPDIEETLKKKGTILGKISAESASAVRNEADAVSLLRERGFTQFPITTKYLMDGSSEEEIEASADSTVRHPYYETYFYSSDNVLWGITEINSRVFANPMTYNQSGCWSVPHIVSESGTYLYYDAMSNTIYEILPDASKLIVKTVAQINANTLETLTAGEVDN